MTPTDVPFHTVVEAMQRYGGSFVHRLADALVAGDEVNRRRLIAAVPDIWQKYETLAREAADRQRQPER